MLERTFLKQPANGKLYVEDVFSTYLYTGNGSTQTITNGIDLAGKGGLVWLKARNLATRNVLYDTVRGALKPIISNSDYAPPAVAAGEGLTAFNSNGFSLGVNAWGENPNGYNCVSWTFREAPKFFDVVTYTGTGSARTIAHNLGVAPGCIMLREVGESTQNWAVYHRGNTSAAYYEKLNLTDAQTSDSTVWNSTAPTDSVFSVGTSALTNASGSTYVAYLFAHDATADGIIQCGSFTTDGSGNATVNLGWEPQWVLSKNSSSAESWIMLDTMRGWSQTNAQGLFPDLSNAEVSLGSGSPPYDTPTSTGFNVKGRTSGRTFIYIAIRRGPMKTPTSGTSVFKAIARVGTGTANFSVTGVGFPPDMAYYKALTSDYPFILDDKLRGAEYLITSDTQAAQPSTTYGFKTFLQDGAQLGSDLSADGGNQSGGSFINHFFRRAPGFFDEVCYTGTGVARTVNHNLGVAPELMIVKSRSSGGTYYDWAVYSALRGASKGLFLNSTVAEFTSTNLWNSTAPTSTVFSLGDSVAGNLAGTTYVAYLFASCPGVSKVGSYTGNGSSQTLNCGFAAGARFVMIKRTDSTGDWYLWDSARGIVAGNDPHLSLNSPLAQVTTDDSVDTDNTGFIVNQVSATNVNVNGASYIYLAIA